MSLCAVNPSAAINAELLELAHSRRTIYENTRLSGENRHRRRVLPVQSPEVCTFALEAKYARNMAMYFGETPHSALVSNQEKELDEALLLQAHSRRSIYEKTRLSGENRRTHHVLPTYQAAESRDSCSDTTDQAYARAMADHFGTAKL
ncbi:hypothetical protein PHYBOEH_009947 [Phytophthora boehmeriae]|uniref:Uncharacterized protein n=1 Tax=Phytophthora boehmeriae TaxID=109152 RepID=A0A8T1VPU1_9STRA|nr:hypothetical protein PHYBOEH_009947 [Phytophthora boehmeriae]